MAGLEAETVSNRIGSQLVATDIRKKANILNCPAFDSHIQYFSLPTNDKSEQFWFWMSNSEVQ